MFSVYTLGKKVKYLGVTTVHITGLPLCSLLTSKLGCGKSFFCLFVFYAKIYTFFVLNSN